MKPLHMPEFRKMKRVATLLLPTVLLSMAVTLCSASIRRVGFFGIAVAGTDYSSFALAYNAAAPGDTILVFPGVAALNQVFTKKLIVIGPGNWLNPVSTPKGNADLQAFPLESQVSVLTFNAGSDGTVVMGFQGGTYYVSTSNITIRRNRDLTVYMAYPSGNSMSNLQVLENYKVYIGNYYTGNSAVTNMNVSNNLIDRFTTATGNTYTGNVSNNVWAYDATLPAATNGGSTTQSTAITVDLGNGVYLLQNNIFASYTSATVAASSNYFAFSNASNSVFNYNLALNTNAPPVWPAGTGNVVTPISNYSSIFSAWPAIGSSSADARYQLNAGSPALTVGAGGTPIGMFAGTTPYKLGTIPSIPTIYQLGSPQGNNPTGNTIQINLSTRGNN
ncbi:MAG: hypothetical protein ABIX01_24220 [Chitinophagaceae bacterium]